MKVTNSSELKWLVRRARPLWKLHVASLFSITIASVLTLLDPLIMKWLIDVALPSRNGHLLVIGTSAFAIVYLGRLALTYWGSITSFIAMQKMIFRTRLKLLRELDRRSAKYLEGIPIGEVLFRIEQDVSRIGDLAGDMLPSIARMLMVSALVLSTMCVLNRRLTFLVLPLMPCIFLLQRRYRSQLVQAADASQAKLGKMSAILQEHLAGILQLQLLNAHARHARKYAAVAADGATAQVHQRSAEIRFSSAYLAMIVLGSGLILGYGGHEVIQGRLTIGGLVAFYSYVTRLFEPLSIAVDLQSRTQRVSASVRRVLEIEAEDTDHSSVGRLRLDREVLPILEFRSVYFGHGNNRGVLEDLSLCVQPRERIALVGVSGSGKTTIAQLAAGLYRPDSGSILLDGHDICSVERRNLRSLISLVAQEPVLFEGTLRDNLMYGDPNATDLDLGRVLSLAQLELVVRRLPRGLNEALGPKGCMLSGGERKRVAVARALLARPKILILDEVTSGLDEVTAARLLRDLRQFQTETTLIFISHNPEAMSAADRILVLFGGRIVDHGNHSQLISRCCPYQELYPQSTSPVLHQQRG